jgi:FixJ family two-component response regulator
MDHANGNGNSKKRGWVKTEHGWEPSDERTQQILFQIRAGRPFRIIAEQFNITVARVSAIRHRAGLPRRIAPASS